MLLVFSGLAVLVLSWFVTHEMVPGKRFDRYHELGQHAFGQSLKKFHDLVCQDCRDIKLTYIFHHHLWLCPLPTLPTPLLQLYLWRLFGSRSYVLELLPEEGRGSRRAIRVLVWSCLVVCLWWAQHYDGSSSHYAFHRRKAFQDSYVEGSDGCLCSYCPLLLLDT